MEVSKRHESRLPVSKATVEAFNSMKRESRSNEPHDTFLRRMMLHVTRSGRMPDLEALNDPDRQWVENMAPIPDDIQQARDIVEQYFAPPKARN